MEKKYKKQLSSKLCIFSSMAKDGVELTDICCLPYIVMGSNYTHNSTSMIRMGYEILQRC